MGNPAHQHCGHLKRLWVDLLALIRLKGRHDHLLNSPLLTLRTWPSAKLNDCQGVEIGCGGAQEANLSKHPHGITLMKVNLV